MIRRFTRPDTRATCKRIRSYLLTAYLNGKPTRFVRLRALGPVSFLATGKFLDVHAGLSKYHPEFASQVNRELEGRTTCRWALEPKANRIEGGESCRAVGTNHAHSLFSLPVIDGNGGATSRESVHRMPSAFVGWGGPRSDEKGDPRLTRSVRLQLHWITPRHGRAAVSELWYVYGWQATPMAARLALGISRRRRLSLPGFPMTYFKSLGLP